MGERLWTGGVVCVFLLGVGMAGPALAGGVEVQDQGRGQAHSNAGVRATADDATTSWWNPAGMACFRRHSVAVTGFVIIPQGEFADRGSFRVPPPTLVPFTGEAGLTDEATPGGGIFSVWSLSPRLKVGLSVNVPFGLTTDWGRTWVGRYHATRSSLLTINVNPSVAYRINRCWSVGAGVSLMYADAELSNAVDFGAIAGAPQTLDGQVKITGDGWAPGFNAGVLFEPTRSTRIGLTYRSRVTHDLAGTAEFEVPAAASPIVAATGRFTNTPVSADITFPDSAGLGVYQQLNPCWALLGEVQWTGWSSFDELRVRFANPAEADAVMPFGWDDAWRVAAGVTFRPNAKWTLRTGVAWDQSPIPDATRGPRIPTNDRYWVSGGVGYRFNRCFSVDLQYTHVFMDKASINQVSAAAGGLIGEVEGAVDSVSLQLNFDF